MRRLTVYIDSETNGVVRKDPFSGVLGMGRGGSLFSSLAIIRGSNSIPPYLIPLSPPSSIQPRTYSTKNIPSSPSSLAQPSSTPLPHLHPAASEPPKLTHLTPTGEAHMVNITAKSTTSRSATAVGRVYFSNPTPLQLIRTNALKKGDVLSVARIAGIMAVKKCPDIIPLCHPILISGVSVSVDVQEGGSEGHGYVQIEATVECVGQTGVEMEALTAVMGAGLTVVDMCKAVDKRMVIGECRVTRKVGGRSGEFVE